MSKPATRLLLVFTILIVYAAFLTHDYYWDGISFAQAIEEAGNGSPLLFHPNHLLYNWIGFAAYRIVNLAFPVRALYVLQSLNVLLAAAAALAFLSLLERLKIAPYTRVCCVWLFAFSMTWWRFATDADAYILSILFLILAFHQLVACAPRAILACAMLHVAAMSIHELAFLFFPVPLFIIVQRDKSLRWRMTRLLLYTACAGLGIAGIYALAYRQVAPLIGHPGLWHWVASHSQDSAFSFHFAANLTSTVKSYARLLLGGRPSLLKGQITAIFILSTALALLVAVGFVAIARRLPREPEEGYNPHAIRRVRNACILWMLTYAVFLFFWLPNNTFYKLFFFPALILLVALAPWRGRRTLSIAAALVFFANFTLGIYPYAIVGNNLVAFSRSLPAKLPPGSIVLYHDYVPNDWYMRYFSPQARWIKIETADQADSQLLKAAAGHNSVWMDESAALLLKQSAAGTQSDLKDASGTVMLRRLSGLNP